MVDAAQAAGAFGFLGREKVKTTAVDILLGPASGDFACVLVTARDGKVLQESARLLISTPGYALASFPGSKPPRPQNFVLYPGTKDWWTLEPELPGHPSGNRGGGASPVWMERVESVVTLRSAAKKLTVYPLDGAGGRLPCLPAGAVKVLRDAFDIHLQGEGQTFAPWYEVVAAF